MSRSATRVDNPDVSLSRVGEDPLVACYKRGAGEPRGRNQNAVRRVAMNGSGKGDALNGNRWGQPLERYAGETECASHPRTHVVRQLDASNGIENRELPDRDRRDQ